VAELVDANTGEWKKSQPFKSAIGDRATWIDRAGSSPAGGIYKGDVMEQDYLDWKTFVNPSMPPDLRLRAEKSWLQRRNDGMIECADIDGIKARLAFLEDQGEEAY